MGPCVLPARETLRLSGKTYDWGQGGRQTSKVLPIALSLHTPSNAPGDEQIEEDLVRSLRRSWVKREILADPCRLLGYGKGGCGFPRG